MSGSESETDAPLSLGSTDSVATAILFSVGALAPVAAVAKDGGSGNSGSGGGGGGNSGHGSGNGGSGHGGGGGNDEGGDHDGDGDGGGETMVAMTTAARAARVMVPVGARVAAAMGTTGTTAGRMRRAAPCRKGWRCRSTG